MSNFLMGEKVKIIGVFVVFFVLTIEAFRKSFHNFLEKFIRRVFITDSVLNSIGAFE